MTINVASKSRRCRRNLTWTWQLDRRMHVGLPTDFQLYCSPCCWIALLLWTRLAKPVIVMHRSGVHPSVCPIFFARAACLPRGLYVLLALISFFLLKYTCQVSAKRTQDLLDRLSPNFYHNNIITRGMLNKPFTQIISGSTGPIFKFSPYGRYLIVDCWFDPP